MSHLGQNQLREEIKVSLKERFGGNCCHFQTTKSKIHQNRTELNDNKCDYAPYPSLQSVTLLGHMTLLMVSYVTTELTQKLLRAFKRPPSSYGADLGLPYMYTVPWSSFGFNGKVQ